MTDTVARRWHEFWQGQFGDWILNSGLRIALLLIGGLLAARFISWSANGISRRIDARFRQSDALVRTESAKHRQAVASVISYVFGDLVQLTLGSSNDAMGTVEDVTLRVTKLRTPEGEMYTIPNGQIMKTLNLSKDWARAVIDIPVPITADLNAVNEVLHTLCDKAVTDPALADLLLDSPQLMGVESIGVDTVNLRMVARTLPGKQFEVGRRLRLLVIAALTRAGIVTAVDSSPMVGAMVHPATTGGAEQSTQGPDQ
ncbi:MAG: mechanosensitive ion channel family protein [Mycobacterium sp.]|nr:mechanosensitive ion channel family protein [Mycobacterium sp.]